MTAANDVDAITDRLAIVDLVNRYFAATDAKDWDAVADFYTETPSCGGTRRTRRLAARESSASPARCSEAMRS
jgi:hypothetical protein